MINLAIYYSNREINCDISKNIKYEIIQFILSAHNISGHYCLYLLPDMLIAMPYSRLETCHTYPLHFAKLVVAVRCKKI